MAELEADTVVILSSELISKIVGEYFNRKMFKESVEIVDLKPTETGYMFSVAFVKKEVAPVVEVMQPATVEELNSSVDRLVKATLARADNGRFVKSEVK